MSSGHAERAERGERRGCNLRRAIGDARAQSEAYTFFRPFVDQIGETPDGRGAKFGRSVGDPRENARQGRSDRRCASAASASRATASSTSASMARSTAGWLVHHGRHDQGRAPGFDVLGLGSHGLEQSLARLVSEPDAVLPPVYGQGFGAERELGESHQSQPKHRGTLVLERQRERLGGLDAPARDAAASAARPRMRCPVRGRSFSHGTTMPSRLSPSSAAKRDACPLRLIERGEQRARRGIEGEGPDVGDGFEGGRADVRIVVRIEALEGRAAPWGRALDREPRRRASYRRRRGGRARG